MNNNNKHLGEQIRSLRKQQQLTQVELAKLLKTKQGYIHRLETGQQNITVNTLERIAKALKVKLIIELIKI